VFGGMMMNGEGGSPLYRLYKGVVGPMRRRSPPRPKKPKLQSINKE
jgi:hypothetical protein